MTLPISERSKRIFAFSALPYALAASSAVAVLGPYHPISFAILASYFTAYTIIIGIPMWQGRRQKRPVLRCTDPDCHMCERGRRS